MIRTREATLNDLPILLQFEQSIIKAERPYDKTIRPDPVHYHDLKSLILNEKAVIIVAEEGGVLVGSGYALIKSARPYLDHAFYAHLGFMYTPPEYRGKGVNRLIVKALTSWADAKGLAELRLTVYSDNEAAIRAYEKSGFKKHIVEMRME